MASARERRGSGLVLLGLLAIARAWTAAAPGPTPEEVGEPVPLEIESLSGDAFRLLPGVGPVLAERLEAARRAAGGRLDEQLAGSVPGVGPALQARWRALRAR